MNNAPLRARKVLHLCIPSRTLDSMNAFQYSMDE
jgi:hypothetical protein